MPIALFALAMVGFVSAGISMLNPADTYADGSSISLTVSSDTLSFDLLPNSASGVFAKSEDVNVGVVLSGVGGYTLSMRASNGAHASDPKTLVNATYSDKVIPTLSTAVSESDFSGSSNYNNMWGYKPSKLNSIDNTNYQPAPSASGDILDKTSGTNDEGNYTISFGARVNMDTAAGVYSNTFVIAAVANATCNPNATGILEAICMQDMNDAVVASMEINKQYELVDTRDSKVYQIARMKDGIVWMLDNLRLGSNDDPIALTSADTNIPGTYTLPQGITSGFSGYTDPHINAAYKNDPASPSYSGVSNKVGTYYNYCAATANQVCTTGDDAINATQDICPAGWRMPTGGKEDKKTGLGEYQALYYAYNSNRLIAKTLLLYTSPATFTVLHKTFLILMATFGHLRLLAVAIRTI